MRTLEQFKRQVEPHADKVTDVPPQDVKRLDHNLHASCGCHWESRGKSPAHILKDALTHNYVTGHTVTLLGEIR